VKKFKIKILKIIKMLNYTLLLRTTVHTYVRVRISTHMKLNFQRWQEWNF